MKQGRARHLSGLFSNFPNLLGDFLGNVDGGLGVWEWLEAVANDGSQRIR